MQGMPKKLVIVLVLLGINVLLSLGSKSWIGAGIGVACIAGLFKANDVVRKVIIVFSIIGMVFNALGIMGGLTIMAIGEMGMAMFVLASCTYGIAANIFVVYALTREEVKTWMLNKGMGKLEAAASQPKDF